MFCLDVCMSFINRIIKSKYLILTTKGEWGQVMVGVKSGGKFTLPYTVNARFSAQGAYLKMDSEGGAKTSIP